MKLETGEEVAAPGGSHLSIDLYNYYNQDDTSLPLLPINMFLYFKFYFGWNSDFLRLFSDFFDSERYAKITVISPLLMCFYVRNN